jgi:hypothetical protein
LFAYWVPHAIVWAFLTFTVNIVETIRANTSISIPDTVRLAKIADTINTISSIDTVTSTTCPLLVNWAVRHTIIGVPVLVGGACVADSIDQIKSGVARTCISVKFRVLTTRESALVIFSIPLLTLLTVITLSIDNVVSLVTLASRSIEKRVGSTCCACSINFVVALNADTTSVWSVIKDIVHRALNASTFEILETLIAEAVDTIPATIGWATDFHTLASTNNSTKGTFTQTSIVEEDWMTDTFRANTMSNDEIMEAYVIDSCSIYGTNLQDEVVVHVRSEW